jgi:DNA-binding NarL/FixJ family response regulator
MTRERKTPMAPAGAFCPVRTLLVDDSTVLLSCMSLVLGSHRLVQVVGTAVDGREALSKAVALMPDLVLMDLHMPRMDGLQATEVLRRRLPGIRIIIMTLDETTRVRTEALAHGADGFVGKSRMTHELTTEIQRVFQLKCADDERAGS